VKETHYDRDIRAFCRQQQIIYQSFWTLSANPHLLADAVIVDLGMKYGRTAAQILFRYLTQNGIVPLTGTRTETHMREDLGVFEFELAAAERARVDDIL
jgi:diketogulonate reductase-like aldo/keto reductase